MNGVPPIKPVVITMGDPAGIGPEICARCISSELLKKSPMLLVGAIDILQQAFKRFGNIQLETLALRDLSNFSYPPDRVGVLSCSDLNYQDLELGKESRVAGKAAIEAIRTATNLCLNKEAVAMVTAPVSKAAIKMVEKPFCGHTGWIAKLCGCHDEMMLMYSHKITVGFVTTHLALREVANKISRSGILHCLRLMHQFLLQNQSPLLKIGVCGLNPHAGEGGMMGREEQEIIYPALAEARQENIECEGPLPADTLFVPGIRERFAAFLCMYHDQGGIPFKMLAFSEGVNLTLGLPIIRTSVDHGTAWDLAWQGKADCGSMQAAIEMAIKMGRAVHYETFRGCGQTQFAPKIC